MLDVRKRAELRELVDREARDLAPAQKRGFLLADGP
jgi:hypothetical protein